MNPHPTPIRKVSARKYLGLGDVVEAVAKPIARAIEPHQLYNYP